MFVHIIIDSANTGILYPDVRKLPVSPSASRKCVVVARQACRSGGSFKFRKQSDQLAVPFKARSRLVHSLNNQSPTISKGWQTAPWSISVFTTSQCSRYPALESGV